MPSVGLTPVDASPQPTRAPASTPPTPRHKRYLRNYLLDPGLQLRYIGFVTLLAAVICGVFAYFIWAQKNQASQVIIDGIRSVEWIDDAMKAEITRDLRASDRGIIWKMAGFGVGLVFVLSGFLIVMTHKVAGPLYKTGMYFSRLRDGQIPRVTDLRRGDQFHDFFEHFKDMNDALRLRTQHECDVYDRFLRACEGQPELSVELRGKLEELATTRKQKLESLA